MGQESPMGNGAAVGVHVGRGHPRYPDSWPHCGRLVRPPAGQGRLGREHVLVEGAAGVLGISGTRRDRPGRTGHPHSRGRRVS